MPPGRRARSTLRRTAARVAAGIVLSTAAVAQNVVVLPLAADAGTWDQRLEAHDPEARRRALQQLAMVSASSPAGYQATLPRLLRLVAAAPSEDEAETAAWIALQLGPQPLAALDVLRERLAIWTAVDAAATATIRARMDDPSGRWPVPAILPALETLLVDPTCTHDVLGVLAMLGPEAARSLPAVDAQLGSERPGIRWRAAFALAAIGVGGAPSLQLALEDRDARIRRWAARASIDHRPPRPAYASAVREAVGSTDRQVLRWAIPALGALGAEVGHGAAQLAELLEEGDPDLRRGVWRESSAPEALAALQRLGPHAAAAVEAVSAQFTAKADHRIAAATTLGAIGRATPAAIDRMVEMLGYPAGDPELEAEVTAAARALAVIAPDRAIAALLPAILTPRGDDPLHWTEVWRFRQLGPAGAPAMPQLAALLRGDDPASAHRALLAIEGLGAAAEPAMPQLVERLDGDDPFLRQLALAALRAIGPAAAPAMPHVARCYDAGARITVVRGLHRLGPVAEPLLRRAAEDPAAGANVRAQAAVELALLDAPAEESLALLLRLMREPAFGPAAVATADLAVRARRPALAVAMLHNPYFLDTANQTCATEALIALWPTEPTPRPDEATTTSDRPLLRRWLLRSPDEATFAELTDADALRAWCLPFAGAEDPQLRTAAATLLSRLPIDDASLTALLRLADDAAPSVRAAACAALGRTARTQHAGAARPLLLRHQRDDPHWPVRVAASTALRRLPPDAPARPVPR
ncbi:MAG: HEAT repeat domain-containing protein [Planctomycetota bacterium]